MSDFFTFIALTFTTFFPMVDPIGILPLFAALTEDMPRALMVRIAFKASLMAFFLLIFLGFFGKTIFAFFGISTDGLKIVGGVVFFIMGYDMLQAHIGRTKVSPEASWEESPNKEVLEDISLTPLAIPLICGPGAITQAILLMDKTENSLILQVAMVIGTAAIILTTFICLICSGTIRRIIGAKGIKVVVRLMGLLLMVLATESLFNGLTPIVQKMLKIPPYNLP